MIVVDGSKAEVIVINTSHPNGTNGMEENERAHDEGAYRDSNGNGWQGRYKQRCNQFVQGNSRADTGQQESDYYDD